MNTNLKKTLTLALAAVSLGACAAAQACDLQRGGFLAAVVECAAPELAPVVRVADRLNGQFGNPVDHAAARAAEAWVPGSGTALEAGWALQRSGALRQAGGRQQPMAQPVQQGGFPNAGGWNRQPPLMPVQMQPQMPMQMQMQMQPQMQQPMLGAHCATPAGVFGPGPVQAVGAPCHAYTPMGPVMGMVVM